MDCLMKRYEYKVVEIYESCEFSLEKRLNELGKQGWEFIYIRRDYTYIFKREIIDNKKEEGL